MAKIYWDKGHGGTDPGALGNGLKEADVVSKIVDYAMKYIDNNYTGVQQKTSRTGDQTRSLSYRTDDANAWGADILISVHNNAFNKEANGFESFIYTKTSSDTKRLQDCIHSATMSVLKSYSITDRGQKQGNLHMVRESNMSAVLTENLFIDASEGRLLKDNSFLKKIGEAHAKGAAKYLGLKRKETVKVASVDANIGKSDTPAIGKITIMHDVLNIRTGTTLDYRKVGTAKKGETYKVFGFLNGWANIGKYRWISNVNGDKWSKYEPYAVENITSLKHTVDNTNNKGIGYAVINADVLNIRTGTTLEYDIKGQAYKGDKFEVYDIMNDWLNIGKYRWISSVDGTKWSAFVKYENDSDNKKVQAKSSDEKMYRIIVDGDQIGAYSESANVLTQVRQAMPELKDSIVIEEI